MGRIIEGMNTSIGSTVAKYFMESSCQLLESFFDFTFDCGKIGLNLPTCVTSAAICQQEKPGSQVSNKGGIKQLPQLFQPLIEFYWDRYLPPDQQVCRLSS